MTGRASNRSSAGDTGLAGFAGPAGPSCEQGSGCPLRACSPWHATESHPEKPWRGLGCAPWGMWPAASCSMHPTTADEEAVAQPLVARAGRAGRWQFWRSPPDQPRWARPALLLVAALAALSYSWGSGDAQLETFYGGAVRSMSQNWHNFFFAAFDPWGTVSVDKLPGAFWVQALFVHVVGFHIWALVVPQAIEGTLTVLVLYRAVRRIGGARAGLVAAVGLGATPVTVLLDRGNLSDTLLILLLVLAADCATAAFLTGRLQSLRLRRCLRRPGLPGQDAAGLDRPARAVPGVHPRRTGRQPRTARRAGRALCRCGDRRVTELDVRGHSGPCA